MPGQTIKLVIRKASVFRRHRVDQYYRPAIDFAMSQLGESLASYTLAQQIKASDDIRDRLSKAKIEVHRRPVRRLIIEAAEKLWEGIDPYPVEVKNIFGEVVGLEANPTLPGPKQFAIFRDRYCPTSKLARVLFPDAKLAEDPLSAAAQKGYDWIKDPTMALKGKQHFKRVSEQWLTATALQMLYDLTDFHDRDYDQPGYGGSCTVWIEATKEWHTQRLDSELASGAVIRMEQITPQMRLINDGMHRGIANLRERLGLTRNPIGMQELPEHDVALARSLFAHQVNRNRYNDQFQYLPEASEASVNKYFHRIMRDACNRCPRSSFLFFPVGLAGLLEHMRTHHPITFYATSFQLLG